MEGVDVIGHVSPNSLSFPLASTMFDENDKVEESTVDDAQAEEEWDNEEVAEED